MKNELKANIKQIGSIPKGNAVYIEDYVMTFIKYMEERRVCDELIFLLLGKTSEQEGEEALFISGAVEGTDLIKKGSISVFSPKGWEEAIKRKDKFFPELEIVGWAYVQPGYGDFLNESHTAYHLDTFKKPFQVLYITDPLDKSQVFYRKRGKAEELMPINGYYIYYDKNEPMHEYLLEVKKEAALTEPKKENLTEEVDSMIGAKLRRRKINQKSPFNFSLPSLPKIIRETKAQETTDTVEEAEVKAVPLLGYLSFALLFVTVIIGGGLLKSNSRIEYLEKQVGSLGKNYISLRENVENTEKSIEVFAQAEEAAEPVTEAVTEKPTEAVTEAATAAAETAQVQPEYREYTVQSGDTLLYLSRYFYGTEDRVEDIMAANNMTDADKLIEGKSIKIPQ